MRNVIDNINILKPQTNELRGVPIPQYSDEGFGGVGFVTEDL